jgi:hypothetical protein
VHALSWGALVRAERVVRAAGGERGEHGLPDRLAGRGQQAVQQPGRIRQPGQRHPPVGLLQPFLGRARAVRVQVRQDPLTQQPHRARVHRPGMLQQSDLDGLGVLGPVTGRDRLHRVGDRGRMRSTDRTVRESRSNSRVNRLQRLTAQRPPSTEPLHRPRPTPSLHPSAAHLRGDQISQPPQTKLAGNVPRPELSQHLQLPVLHPSKLGLQPAQLSQQLCIRGSRQRLDHMFDSTVQAKLDQPSISRKPI